MQTITLDESSAALRRIVFVAELAADRNEIQEIDLGDLGAGDTFTLTYNAVATGSIAYDSFSAGDGTTNIDTALEALAGVDTVTVTKQTGQVYRVEFTGTHSGLDQPIMSITSPSGFTPVGVEVVQYAGVAGSAARGEVFVNADVTISRNGSAIATSAGTFTELGDGRYYYEATAGEVATQGFLSLALVKEGLKLTFPTAQVVASSSTLGAPVIRSSTAQAGASGSITLDASASSVSNFYVPALIYIRTNTGAGQARLIWAYNGSTKVASIEPNWVTPPDNTSVFDILPVEPLMVDLLRANHSTVDTFGEVATVEDIAVEVQEAILDDATPFSGADIGAIEGRIPAALVGGRMDSNASALGGSETAATRLKAHVEGVYRVQVTSGSTTSTVVLHPTTGIEGGVPSSVADFYNGRTLVFTSGALAGQAKRILDYNGSTFVLTVQPLTDAPADGATGVIV